MASAAGARPWTAAVDGLRLSVRLTPRGGRDAIDGIEILSDGRPVLKARVRAAPSEGEANASLLALIARTLDLPRSAVTLAAGASARLKTVAIAGDPTALGARLEAIAARR
ncbi:DUF167 family protein [Bosea sp. (in: a-proteobacteria)]|uniref:DUF167 family protein n=1 Tax=Bosea sp. (in: a-proteobacteria) TaxID=1871050 RepID=UPI0027338C3C|nr:DUF167 family protein [Bosea sp. (in: a-proteobacteria)]MDP3254374.1 DUF167 family protein [Bosea sp. (in: a-proteobacteria)]